MQFRAVGKFLRYSPYKLRPLADVIRGKRVAYALDWLSTCALMRAEPIKKVLASAAANAKHASGHETKELIIKDIRIDEGPRHRYFRPGAMGRSNPYMKRLSHVQVIVEPVTAKGA